MLRLLKKIMFACALLSVSSFSAYGSDGSENDVIAVKSVGKSLEAGDAWALPRDMTSLIFLRSVDRISVKKLRLVCRNWNQLIAAGTRKQGGLTPYPELSPFWKKFFMAAHVGLGHEEKFNRFLSAVITIQNPVVNPGDLITFRISDQPNPFKFNFPFPENDWGFLTTDISFGKAPEHNDKSVLMFGLRRMIERQCESTTSHLVTALQGWDGVACPVGLFLRAGNWEENKFDFVRSAPVEAISASTVTNIFENHMEQSHLENVGWSKSCFFPVIANLRITFENN